jgi:anti-sigma28 factor (negative regulator of flagellin synthesis)
MRVNDRNLTGTSPAESGRAQETQKLHRNEGVRTGTAATDKSGDRVELSSTLETLSRALSASGSERASRVQALAAQYQSGSYHADSAATARGMVSEALLAESQ